VGGISSIGKVQSKQRGEGEGENGKSTNWSRKVTGQKRQRGEADRRPITAKVALKTTQWVGKVSVMPWSGKDEEKKKTNLGGGCQVWGN